MARRARVIDEKTLQSIVREEIHTAVGYIGGDISEERRRAMDYYLGNPFGNELEGRSQVVSTDVQDVIETVMPDFMEIFAGGDQVVRYQPMGPEDEDVAEQATDYANYIFHKDNDGFGIIHDWVKDGLLQKNGIIKVYWDESEVQKRETFENINALALQDLLEDDSVEVIEQTEKEVPPELMELAPDGLWDITIIRTDAKGRVKIVPVPPEEFLIARRSVSLLDADFVCHKTRKTQSELLQMGYDLEVIQALPSHDEQDYNEERVARFDDDEWPELDDSLDPAMREIWLYECYLKVDFDGDGVTELRQVTVAGPGWDVLDNEEVDDHPFCSLTPIRMPHKFFGRSLADLTIDIQLLKSTVQRQILDNMYFVNNGRTAISTKVDLDDYLTNRPGGAVRVDTQNPDVAGHVAQITTEPLGHHAYPLLEYFDGVRETRTGVTRLNQGLDADSLNKTASGMNQLLGRTQRRILLIARVFAETGFKSCFRKILNLIVTRQDRARVIRLRNEWHEMDPKAWNAEMDVETSVGLGYGTKEQQAMLLQQILMAQQNIIQFQGGVDGPLVTMQNVHGTLKKWVHAIGEKNADIHFTDPQNAPQQQEQPPDPKMIEVQMKAQEAEGKQQIEVQKLRQNQLEFQEEMRLKWAEFEADHALEQQKLGLETEKAGTDRDRAIIEHNKCEKELALKEKENEGKDVDEAIKALEESSKALNGVQDGSDVKSLAKGIEKMAEQLGKPKKVIRENGQIVGVE